MRGSLEAEFHATCRVIIIIIIILFFFLPPSVLQSFECNDRVLAFTLEEAAMFVVPTGRFTDPLLVRREWPSGQSAGLWVGRPGFKSWMGHYVVALSKSLHSPCFVFSDKT